MKSDEAVRAGATRRSLDRLRARLRLPDRARQDGGRHRVCARRGVLLSRRLEPTPTWFELSVPRSRRGHPARAVDAHWSTNHEHPGLVKSHLRAVVELALQEVAPLRRRGDELPLRGNVLRGRRSVAHLHLGRAGALAHGRTRGRRCSSRSCRASSTTLISTASTCPSP